MSFRLSDLDKLGVAITRLATDSRTVQPGDTFVAYPGAQADGRRFIAQAIANGANAVIWECHGDFVWDAAWNVPNLGVADLRRHAGEIADRVYAQPSHKLWMIGVTGTNGKTSCSHWLAHALGAHNCKTALVGTLGNGFPGTLEPSPNTTPDAIRLHSLLAEYLAQGASAVSMEVSSHALALGRINGVKYDVALFTNLSRDHLDFHGDMDHYAAAKRRLFDWQNLKFAVLNMDDAFGAQTAEELRDGGAEVIGYGLGEIARLRAEKLGLRMVYGAHLQMNGSGLQLEVHSSWGKAQVSSALVGRFNASNLLGTLAALLVSGVPLETAVQLLREIQPVAGRMQKFGGAGRPAVVVDYAHTPDALENVLATLREVATLNGGRVICVFGCGGDRDKGKRPMMGRVASKLADQVIVTSDNPRSEDPLAIIDAVLTGAEGGEVQVIADRAAAIAQAIGQASSNDTVLVAGKGHEQYQEIAGVKHPFSDAAAVQAALHHWRAAA
ncbi:MAG: UDP-N-acetylmuramoyl-L-alanyl-D-glutamate--2,6-diaminopimelate ligase [Pseudomonadota bacterium]